MRDKIRQIGLFRAFFLLVCSVLSSFFEKKWLFPPLCSFWNVVVAVRHRFVGSVGETLIVPLWSPFSDLSSFGKKERVHRFCAYAVWSGRLDPPPVHNVVANAHRRGRAVGSGSFLCAGAVEDSDGDTETMAAARRASSPPP